jgi:hypothetical protein
MAPLLGVRTVIDLLREFHLAARYEIADLRLRVTRMCWVAECSSVRVVGIDEWLVLQGDLGDAVGTSWVPNVRGTDLPVDVRPGPGPIFLCTKNVTEFYVRLGNLSRPLDFKPAIDYVRRHWSLERLGPSGSVPLALYRAIV